MDPESSVNMDKWLNEVDTLTMACELLERPEAATFIPLTETRYPIQDLAAEFKEWNDALSKYRGYKAPEYEAIPWDDIPLTRGYLLWLQAGYRVCEVLVKSTYKGYSPYRAAVEGRVDEQRRSDNRCMERGVMPEVPWHQREDYTLLRQMTMLFPDPDDSE